MATKALWNFTAATLPPTLASDLIFCAQGNVVKQITPNNLGLYNGAVLTGTPSNPAGTTNTSGLMMGLGQLFTPGYSTRIQINIVGMMANSTINDGVTAQIRYGTGAAPANAAALTGTAIGAAQTFTSLVAAGKTGFSLIAIVTGLSIGTQYWIDISLAAVTGGTATATNITVTVNEI